MLKLFVSTVWYAVIFHFDELDKGKTAKEEAREMQLKEEALTREKVTVIQKNLSSMLRALGEMAIANPIFTHSQLPSLVRVSCCFVQSYELSQSIFRLISDIECTFKICLDVSLVECFCVFIFV